MSHSAGPWTTECNDDLRLCSDRSSDSDHSQLALSELIDSITCEEDCAGEEAVVADVVERLLDRVEVETSCHEQKTGHRKRDHERKKSRRRSISTSTTSSACSDVSRKARRKHKHHRRKEEDHSPRVNPIFLWVKQDDTRIVEVLCEDYDKRNRIRLTKTAHGWRATPRTERLDSTRSKSSLDLSPPPPSPPPAEHQQPAQTKEKKPKRGATRKYNRCDRKKDKQFNGTCVLEYSNVDVVNNNNSIVSNNNKVKLENSFRPAVEPSLSESRLRSFGYKKACHEILDVDSKSKRKDNNMFEDVDIYTFVPTPKTDEEDSEERDSDLKSEQPNLLDSDLKSEQPNLLDSDLKSEQPNLANRDEETKNLSPPEELIKTDSDPISDTLQSEPNAVINECNEDSSDHLKHKNNDELIKDVAEHITDSSKDTQIEEDLSDHVVNSTQIEEDSKETKLEEEKIKNQNEDIPELVKVHTEDLEKQCKIQKPQSTIEESEIQQLPDSQASLENTTLQEDQPDKNKPDSQIPSFCEKVLPGEPQEPESTKTEIKSYHDVKLPEYNFSVDIPCIIDSSTPDNDEDSKHQESSKNREDETHDEGEEHLPEIILPEPHLLTPEPSPQPVPEPSTTEPESSITEISLQPDTSLDSDTIHLPDTTTKSETSLLISTDISLGQALSIKHHPEMNMNASLRSSPLHLRPKGLQLTDTSQHSQNQNKSASMIQQSEIQRQITADLDEDHLLAIEEILQGEECVEDFDDDDLPEEYPVSHESPVNLVIDLKTKDQDDNIGIPLSLRTDDFLEMFPTPSPMKDNSDTIPSSAKPTKKQEPLEKPIPHAHQQTKTKFLESILSCPKISHVDENKKTDCSVQQEPLYLGVSRKSASPTVSSSDGRKFSSPELEPKPKRMKVEDITLKTILNKNRETYQKPKVSKCKDSEETQQTADSTTKSRLLELLTNESDDHINKLDPLTQLKEVLSDPDLNVPDPLLVPRARLPALVANPAREIPRLMAMKTETLYPKLLTDPDLLVVSLSHLQSLLQAAGKEEEMMKYQQHAQLLQQQMKQEQATLDAATAAALNQMMWLPYLSQLEAAAMACGNSQDFMTMLNSVYPQMNPYLMTPTSTGVNAYDYKSQLEFQQAFALWNEAMMQAATNQFTAQSLGVATNSNNNMSSKLYSDTKYPKQSHSNCSTKPHQEVKHASARTSPITLNYQQNKYRASQFPYQSMFSVPTSTPGTSTTRTTATAQPYRSGSTTQRGYIYGGYSGPSPKPTNRSTPMQPPKPKPPPELKNISHHLPTSTTMTPSSTAKLEPPKLKVKQSQHLVDPHSRPRLLNVMEEHGEVGSTTGSHPTDDAHHNLWHPLFSSHQQKSYSSPWQWTTPVTVAGE